MPGRPIEVFLSSRTSLDLTVSTLKERPILGSGPGTFVYDFSKNPLAGGGVGDEPYWRDVGSRDEFYIANMELREPVPPINLYLREEKYFLIQNFHNQIITMDLGQ